MGKIQPVGSASSSSGSSEGSSEEWSSDEETASEVANMAFESKPTPAYQTAETLEKRIMRGLSMGGIFKIVNSNWFQYASALTILAYTYMYALETATVDPLSKDTAQLLSVIVLLLYSAELAMRYYAAFSGAASLTTELGFLLDTTVVVLGWIGIVCLPINYGIFMNSKFEFGETNAIAFCRMAMTFRLPRIAMLLQRHFKQMYLVQLSSYMTFFVMVAPLIFIVIIASVAGLFTVQLFALIDEADPANWDPDSEVFDTLTKMNRWAPSAWLMFRLCLMDKTVHWNVMEVVAPMYTVPWFMTYIVVVRVAVGIMLFMVVLERADANMAPIFMKEDEKEHMGTFREVQSLFTEPADKDGFLKLSAEGFIQNLEFCPMLMDLFNDMGLRTEDLPYVYKILADGDKLTFRGFAQDYIKISAASQDASTRAALHICQGPAERLWFFCAMIDSGRLHHIAECKIDPEVIELDDDVKKKDLHQLAELARGNDISNPTKIQRFLQTDAYLRFMNGAVVGANLLILFYLYTIGPQAYVDTTWMTIDLIFLAVYVAEIAYRVHAFGISALHPTNKPWMFLCAVIVAIHLWFYLLLPVGAGTFMKTDEHSKYGRPFEVLKMLRFMRFAATLRKIPSLNSFARLNYMYMTNVGVIAYWFFYYMCCSFIHAAFWYFAVGSERYYEPDPDAPGFSLIFLHRSLFFSMTQIFRSVFDDQGVYTIVGIDAAPWLIVPFMIMFISLNLVVAQMLGGMLFVNIEKNRAGPKLELDTWKKIGEYRQIVKTFGVTKTKRTITKDDWVEGAGRSKVFVPALLDIHMRPMDIPGLYNFFDLDGNGCLNVVEFLVVYKHVINTASDPLVTALIELGGSTAERASYLLGTFNKAPEKEDVRYLFPTMGQLS